MVALDKPFKNLILITFNNITGYTTFYGVNNFIVVNVNKYMCSKLFPAFSLLNYYWFLLFELLIVSIYYTPVYIFVGFGKYLPIIPSEFRVFEL